ncbi:MAG: class I SAM-dependent methyltransferase [Nitrospirae bacterium]|nr:class I SAM-dependent methyltransferase [Nitrospirota bacterium]
MKLPEGFNNALNDALNIARGIEGYLSDREMRFLFLLGACPTTEGSVLEIGSFKGKSTVILAKALKGEKIVAVDPLTSPSITDPDLKGKASAWDEFEKNIKNTGVENVVEFHQMFSHELAKDWQRNIRLLWIDGDHTYKGTKTDFDLFSGFLKDRAIIAFHDVLGFIGPLRVFLEDILLSDRFGSSGLVGTIGWAQYLKDKEQALRYKEEKLKLYLKLSRLMPIVSSDRALNGLRRLKYKFLRSRIPHSGLSPEKWLSKVFGEVD